MDISLFANSYTEARQHFLTSLDQLGADPVLSIGCPDPGPQGEALFTDLAWFGPQDAGLFESCLVSGLAAGDGSRV